MPFLPTPVHFDLTNKMPTQRGSGPKYDDIKLIDWMLDKHPDVVVAAMIRLAKRLNMDELGDTHRVAREIGDIVEKLHMEYVLEEIDCALEVTEDED